MTKYNSYWLVFPAILLVGIASAAYFVLPANAPTSSESVPASKPPMANETEGLGRTLLNDRYENIPTDPYCGVAPEGRPWSASTASAEWMALDEEWQAQLGLSFDRAERLVAERPDIRITSWCNYGQEMYITAYEPAKAEGDRYEYEVLVWASGQWNEVMTTFIPKDYAVVKLSTQLYPEERDTLAIIARVGDASYAKWMYGNVNLEFNRVVWDEECTHWYGGGWSPYGDEEKLECTSRYDG